MLTTVPGPAHILCVQYTDYDDAWKVKCVFAFAEDWSPLSGFNVEVARVYGIGSEALAARAAKLLMFDWEQGLLFRTNEPADVIERGAW